MTAASTEMIRAANLLVARGFSIVWLQPGQKCPTKKRWTQKPMAPETYIAGANLGLLTGRISKDLVCIDLDSPEVISLADEHLPPTDMIDDRPGKLRSHRWYVVADIPAQLTSRRAAGGIGGPWTKHFKRSNDNKVILDFLGTGSQAVVPPSVHTSGEIRRWTSDGDPARVPMSELWRSACDLAKACGWSTKETGVTARVLKSHVGMLERARRYLTKVPGAISGQGGHDHTFRVACSLISKFGLSREQNLDILSEWNTRCDPPWTQEELVHKLEDAEKKCSWPQAAPSPVGAMGSSADLNVPPPGSNKSVGSSLPASGETNQLGPRRDESGLDFIEGEGSDPAQQKSEEAFFTDRGNAMRFVAIYGDSVRYCPGLGWYIWDSRRWKPDALSEVMFWMKQSVRKLYDKAIAKIEKIAERLREAPDDEKWKGRLKEALKAAQAEVTWAINSESTPRLKAALESAESEPGVAILPEDFDRDPLVFNCQNGTIDLRTGKLRAHRREDLLSKICRTVYDPEAKSPIWDRFLDRIMDRNADLISYLQRVMGYSLSADVSEQCLWFFHGVGANGKSTFLGTILSLTADYGMQAVPELLLAKSHESHPTERADLFGRRVVCTIETDDGRQMAESLVKQLTGGDRFRARKMRQDFFEFDATWKIFLAANHKPVIRGRDHGIWRRIKMVPFTVTITDEEKDPKLPEKLREELPGILAWMVRGCLIWRANGMGEPDEVRQATAAYQAEQDLLANFMNEVCFIHAEVKVQASKLFDAYQAFTGDRLTTQRAFTKRMEELGFKSGAGTGNRKFYKGIGLPASQEERAELR